MEDREKEERGPKTPGESLEAAIGLLNQVRGNLGFGTSSRETIANAMGYATLNGRSNRMIAALVHFGFLDRSGASAYRISDLGKRVLMPRDDTEYRTALVEAVKQPALYQKLFARFGGGALPAMLPNILVRELGVWPKSSEAVAEKFRESATFAGLLRNGILNTELGEMADEATQAQPATAQPQESTDGSNPPPSAGTVRTSPAHVLPDSQRYTIPLDAHGRLALIEIPVPVAPADLRRISRWTQFMLDMSATEGEVEP